MNRRGSTLLTSLVACCALTTVIALGFWFLRDFDTSQKNAPLTAKVERGDFVWTILDQGDVASSSNIELICEVASKDWNGTPVLEVVPEGTQVTAGDVVCRLDDASLRLDREQQIIKVNAADAAMAEAKSTLESAAEEKREYFEGTFHREIQNLNNELFKAQQELSESREYFNFSRRMWAKGFLTDLQLEADNFAVKKAENSVALALTDIKLLEDHTFKKKEIEFESRIYSATKAMENAENNYNVEVRVLERFEDEIKKCVVTVPEGQSGQVVYPDRWDPHNDRQFIMQPGSMIRENEVIILIPDPDLMQINATVDESRIVYVEEGMATKVRVDALAGEALDGEVVFVGEFAEQDDWLSGGSNRYSVEVDIIDPPETLKPGMNASISIIAEEHPNVLMVPLQAIFENGDQAYALVQTGETWETRPVEIGTANESRIHIIAGLEEGETVALNARAFPHLLGVTLVDEP